MVSPDGYNATPYSESYTLSIQRGGNAKLRLKPGVADSENSFVRKPGLKILRAMKETENFDSGFVGLIEDQAWIVSLNLQRC